MFNEFCLFLCIFRIFWISLCVFCWILSSDWQNLFWLTDFYPFQLFHAILSENLSNVDEWKSNKSVFTWNSLLLVGEVVFCARCLAEFVWLLGCQCKFWWIRWVFWKMADIFNCFPFYEYFWRVLHIKWFFETHFGWQNFEVIGAGSVFQFKMDFVVKLFNLIFFVAWDLCWILHEILFCNFFIKCLKWI